ncbi:hypothetical protein LBMAG52_43540 [Planctomycetia bacterium]|nr:hypothetical protein LBMAG52_43540 [Planctomycetia bacterium]
MLLEEKWDVVQLQFLPKHTAFFNSPRPQHLTITQLQAPDCRDFLVNYCQQGKRPYLIAASYAEDDESREQAPILRHLSEEFELCSEGLKRIRREIDRLPKFAQQTAEWN